ncbi:aldolase [Eremomyces bilateralis CBS 781.70]|uniref:Aldolase n=1 Tax=Eremomyces bilateralis CBS 781.70 TaxID=1392243 RepID=A0A6G1GFI0_9PEZI|nr:aldolase [Eremomyces bilateralis CBS 781.70]KAF1816676.1 aldolase [Eremomyces bilateralis CBS 781.70]
MATESVVTNGAANGHTADGPLLNGNHSISATNGSFHPPSGSRNPLRPGIYCPVLTFFDADDNLDLQAIGAHSVRLAQAGLVGIVTMGSNGEAVHLTRAEKVIVTRTVRAALDQAGFSHIPIMVGTSEQSVTLTLDLIHESAAAGGEYALLVPPSYYRAAMDDAAIYTYFTSVASASPIPLVLYNYPGAVAGIDMDSDLLIRICQHPNIVGCKFTCGNNGKLTREAKGIPYMAFGGMADFTLQTFVSGGSGIIAGGANVFPKTCVRVWKAMESLSSSPDPLATLSEAARLQRVLSTGDWVLTKSAIPGTKSALQSYFGYGGFPRAPLKRLDEVEALRIKDATTELWALEAAL